MRLWRVSRHRDLNGKGGLLVSGRWHTRGNPIVYAAEHQGTAQLEWLAHLEISSPAEYPLTVPFSEIAVPDDASVEEIRREHLPPDWEMNADISRRLGDQWLNGAATLLLFVPSVLVPARNVLINPQHPEARRIRVVDEMDFRLDPRLL